MEITKEVKNLIELVNSKVNSQQQAASSANKITLPSQDLSVGQLAQVLNVLGREYGISLPAMIRKLDRVSGDVRALEKGLVNKDDKLEWTADEDELLNKNSSLLIKWKGEEAVELRKKYLTAKKKAL